MSSRLILFVGLFVALAGCFGDDSTAPMEAADDTEDPEVPDVEEESPPPEPELLDFGFDGRLETGTRICDPQAGTCHEVRVESDDQELQITDLDGQLLSGNATIAWTPASTLTEELRAVAVWVPADCDPCENVVLGVITSSSPIIIDFSETINMTSDGVLRVYVRAPYAEFVGPYYVQPDAEQTFRVDVALAVLDLAE